MLLDLFSTVTRIDPLLFISCASFFQHSIQIHFFVTEKEFLTTSSYRTEDKSLFYNSLYSAVVKISLARAGFERGERLQPNHMIAPTFASSTRLGNLAYCLSL